MSRRNDNVALELQQPLPPSPFSPYVAGLDPMLQQDALITDPIQNKVTILQPVSRSTGCCVNFGLTIISLFSSFLLIIGTASLAFSIWATVKKQTTSAHVMIAISCILIAIAIITAFRGMCFKIGHTVSITIVSILLVATLYLAIHFTFFPAQVSQFVGNYDQSKSQRDNPQIRFVLDPTRGQKSPSNPSQPERLIFELKRDNLGQIAYDNHVVISTVLWLGVVTQVLALIYMVFTFHTFRKRKCVTKVATIH